MDSDDTRAVLVTVLSTMFLTFGTLYYYQVIDWSFLTPIIDTIVTKAQYMWDEHRALVMIIIAIPLTPLLFNMFRSGIRNVKAIWGSVQIYSDQMAADSVRNYMADKSEEEVKEMMDALEKASNDKKKV